VFGTVDDDDDYYYYSTTSYAPRPYVGTSEMVPSVISRGTPHQPTREASISEGRNLNEFSQTAEAGVFYMPQSWDMGQII
jgi:hypothetical protein